MRYSLWDGDTGNIIGMYNNLTELVQSAAKIVLANPDTMKADDLVAMTEEDWEAAFATYAHNNPNASWNQPK